MRWLVVVVSLASRLAVAEPTLDEAVGHAARANKPLVVELYAEWCGPCHTFETEILSRADVKRALGTVDFVRYDIDQPAGEAIAQQFDSTGVPTFIVLDSAGRELMRQVGLGASDAPQKWFLELIAAARERRNMAGTLEGMVRIYPDDAKARMILARYYLANHRTDAAREHLAILVDSPDRAIAAEAFAGLKAIDLAKARVDAALDAAAELVSRFPDTEQSSMPLVLLAASKHVDRAGMHALVQKHLQTVPDEALASAVRAAVLTGHVPLARAQVVERGARPAAAIVDAELSLYASGHTTLPRACSEHGFDFDCFLLEDALANRSPFTSATRYMAKHAKRQLELLEMLGASSDHYPDIGQLVEQPIAFRNAVAANLRGARQQCAALSPARRVWVRIAFAAGRATTEVRGPDEAATCVRKALERAPTLVPPADLETEIYVPLQFASSSQSTRPVVAVGDHGVLAGFAMDPDLEVYTVAAHGQLALGKRRLGQRILVAGDFEMGASAYGFAYAARAYIGSALVVRPWLSISYSAGLGISDFGDELLPRAFTIPVEQRIRVTDRRQQIHLWFRESFVLGDSVRRREGRGIDEWAFGLGTSLANGARQPLYIQVSVEARETTIAKVISLGAAFGLL